MIEHNLSLLSQADWLIDMGPEAGKYGGQVCYSGIPEKSMKDHDSATGQAFKEQIAHFNKA